MPKREVHVVKLKDNLTPKRRGSKSGKDDYNVIPETIVRDTPMPELRDAQRNLVAVAMDKALVRAIDDGAVFVDHSVKEVLDMIEPSDTYVTDTHADLVRPIDK